MKPDKISLFLALLIIFTTFSWVTSCTHKPDLTKISEVCFGEVLNIYIGKCATPLCHDGTGETHLVFKNYNDIRNTVEPFNPDASRSYKTIIDTWGGNRMPPDQPISKESRTIIRLWIEQGANDNRGDLVVCPVVKATGNSSDNDLLNNK